jgi:hypothetical protein
MTSMTMTQTSRSMRPMGVRIGCVASSALIVGGVWNVLVEQHLTVDPPPSLDPVAPPQQVMHTYYAWYATTVGQERAAAIAGMVGVIGLVLVASELRRRLADLLGRAACTTLIAGGVVWVVGAILTIGGQRAVGLMASHGNPIETVNSIAFTTDVTSDAFSAGAFTLFGLGLVALGPSTFGGRRWAMVGTVAGIGALVVAYGYLAGVASIATFVLGVLAAVLTPVWLIWTGRLLDRTVPPA